MAIKLVSAPKIKITLTSDEVFDEYYPDYSFTNFKLTKKLLEPNCFEFEVVKNNLTLDSDDVFFMMKDDLLGAKVECSLTAHRYDYYDEEWVEDSVENFFYGYIQNIKVIRKTTRQPVTFRCIAYSPDARLKHFPSCCTFNEYTLKDCVTDVLGCNAGEQTVAFKDGEYPDIEGLSMDVNPHYTNEMPYTVQYNESPYDFLKRLAIRYGEFFYYEDGEVVFGKIKEKEIVSLHTGFDLEEYNYDLNMNHHTGIVFAEHNRFVDAGFVSGLEKYPNENTGDELWTSGVQPENDMARAAFEGSTMFFNDNYNAVHELANAPFEDKMVSILKPNMAGPHLDQLSDDEQRVFQRVQNNKKFAEENNFEEYTWTNYQRNLLDCYVAADSLICNGKAGRADLKLGSVIALEDETNTKVSKEDWLEHDPLVVIELTYEWDKNHSLKMENTFKAMAKDSPVPPYLKRDEQGFLTYKDFDLYPKCGPQHGIVIDPNDPEHLGRVKVVLLWQNAYGRAVEGENYFPYLEKKQCTPWIWMTNHYNGYHHGTHIIPEMGDQVMVGFEHNNAEKPYVLGCMNSQNAYSGYLDHERNKKNNIKAFRTRSGQQVVFYDGGDKNTWGGYIEITDSESDQYKITLSIDDSVIRLQSKGNIELIAGNNIVMKAGNNIKMEAKQDIKSTAQHDILTTAEHDMVDEVKHDMKARVENDRQVKFGNEYLVQNNDEIQDKIVLNKDEARISLDDKNKINIVKKDGIDICSQVDASISSDSGVWILAKQSCTISSDTYLSISGKSQASVTSNTETVISGPMVKIN